MGHAFLITAYTDAKQLLELVKSLEDPASFFYIHLDKKSSIKNAPELFVLRKSKNVHFIPEPVQVYWGGFSHLRAFLMLMNVAVSNPQVSYMHTLSGQDYPIVSVEEIKLFFDSNKGKEFITCAPLATMNWTGGSYNRLHHYHLNDHFNIRMKFWKRINSRFLQLQRIIKLQRPLPGNYQEYYGGGTWWSLSKKAVEYIFDVIEEDQSLLPKFKNTHCSEEIFFQTILMNSPFKENIISDDLRYVDWNTRDGNCPAVLNETDLEPIKKSGKLFARKFVSGVSDKLKEQLRK